MCGPGECRRMGTAETAAEELGGWGSGRTLQAGPHLPVPPRERSRCRPAHRTKPPAPTPPGRSAPVLLVTGVRSHCRQTALPLSPHRLASPCPGPVFSLLCSFCAKVHSFKYALPGRWQAASVMPLKAEPALMNWWEPSNFTPSQRPHPPTSAALAQI